MKPTEPAGSPGVKRPLLKSAGMVVLGLACLVWLANPTFGADDMIPIIGNLDEAAVTLILLRVLAYFGVHLQPEARRKEEERVVDIGGPDEKR